MIRWRSPIIKGLLSCIVIWPLVAWIGARLLITQAPLETADVIVVLGGSANYQERAREAAQLLLEGRSQRILITNDNARGPWSSTEQRNPFFYERSSEEIRSAGVPANSIDVLMTPVANTHEEAVLVRRYAEEQGLRSVLIVTSGYHSRRALWAFSRVFRNTDIQIGLISATLGNESPEAATWWLTARGWRSVPTEYVKMVYYVIKYG